MSRARVPLGIALAVGAWAAALGSIAGLRPAALYRQSTQEGLMFVWVGVLCLLSWLLGLAAAWLLGGRSRTRRVLVGVALLGPVLASVLGVYVNELDLSHCWRTCAPFPR